MFTTSAHYVTTGIAQNVKVVIQQLLWQIIDHDLKQGIPLDYLQVFMICGTFVNGKPALRITHRQEQPNRKKVYLVLNLTSNETITVWVIDSGSYCTMLLPSEYY